MAEYLAELYSPKPDWLALEPQERMAFFEEVGRGMAALTALNVEPLALGEVDAQLAHAPSQRFFALWKCPDRAALEALVAGIAASGWHEYFETVNAAGTGTDLNGHLAQLARI